MKRTCDWRSVHKRYRLLTAKGKDHCKIVTAVGRSEPALKSTAE